MEAAGIERAATSLEAVTQKQLTESTDTVSAYCLHSESTSRHDVASDDTILRRVIRCWPAIPDDTKQSINAIIVDALLFDV